MASVLNQQQVTFSYCIVCERSYKHPSTLACGDKICRGCLAKCKKSQRDRIDAKSILCPKCCQLTKVADPDSDLRLENIRAVKEEFDPCCQMTRVAAPDSDLRLENIRAVKEEFDPYCITTLVEIINISTENDEKTPRAGQVTVVDVDGTETLVVCDIGNNSIKSFYTKEKQARHSSLQLDEAIGGLTRLGNNHVAVSLYFQTALVQVTPDLVLLRTIIKMRNYKGLTALNDSTLVFGCHTPPSLDPIETTGIALGSIKPTGIVVKKPGFLCTSNNGNIIVSHTGRSSSIYCLSPDGDAVFNFSPSKDVLNYPLGITTSTTGDILVADYYGCKVIQLTSTGHFVRDILTSKDGIDHPYDICLHKHKLYLTQGNALLKVFHISKTE